MGQTYVLVSRCTDPANSLLRGVPPKDLLEDASAAIIARWIDVGKYFEDACSVTRSGYTTKTSRCSTTNMERSYLLRFARVND